MMVCLGWLCLSWVVLELVVIVPGLVLSGLVECEVTSTKELTERWLGIFRDTATELGDFLGSNSQPT